MSSSHSLKPIGVGLLSQHQYGAITIPRGPRTAKQCQVANATLGRTDCCDNPDSCNTTIDTISYPLNVTGILFSTGFGPVGFDEIVNAIDHSRPVAIGVNIQNSQETYGHDLSVIGYDPSLQLLCIADPEGGISSQYSYSALKNGNCPYDGAGGGTIIAWRLTCFTRA